MASVLKLTPLSSFHPFPQRTREVNSWLSSASLQRLCAAPVPYLNFTMSNCNSVFSQSSRVEFNDKSETRTAGLITEGLTLNNKHSSGCLRNIATAYHLHMEKLCYCRDICHISFTLQWRRPLSPRSLAKQTTIYILKLVCII